MNWAIVFNGECHVMDQPRSEAEMRAKEVEHDILIALQNQGIDAEIRVKVFHSNKKNT